jgi:uncharacterized repeat protein (TIGR01451 family)
MTRIRSAAAATNLGRWQHVLLAIAAASTFAVSASIADPGSPISVTKTDSPDPVASGAEITYTITVRNTGGSRLTNVGLSDQVNGVGGIGVPPQLVLTSSRGSCIQTGNLVTCSAGNIEGNGSWVVTIRGIVTAANGTTLNNTVSVSGTRSAQNFTTTATATTLVSNNGGSGIPDLSISKAGPTSVNISSPMSYTLTINNAGTANATDVTVVDTVPAGLTGIAASGTSLFTCGVVGQTVTCTGGAVNQGANATITINATSPAVVGTITNTASVDPNNTIGESDELNNTSALVDTQVTQGGAAAALTINKTDKPAEIAGAGPDPVNPGGLLTYKILVTNTGSQRADDVVMVDGTQGLEASSIVAAQVITNGTQGNTGGCTVEAPQVRCVARTLNGGGTILYTITGRVVASAGSTIFNTATVTGNIRNAGVTNTDSELTTVKPGIDLTITKSDQPDPVCARSWPGVLPAPPVCRGGLTYTFVIGNSGTSQVTGVVVRDPLPAGTILDSAVAPAFTGGCAVNAGVLTCTNGTIPPESTVSITIVLVAPPTTGTIVNTVTVDPTNAIFESDETNNTATQSTQVVTGIDLTVTKVDSAPGFDPIATGGTQTYTITVDNIGTQDATNIRLVDTLPANTVFRDAIADPLHGFTCSYSGGIGEGGTGGVVTCVGGAVKGTASEFYPPLGAPGNDFAAIAIRVFAPSFAGTMHNEVRVDPLNEIPEANEANNFAFADTTVHSGGGNEGAFNELQIDKTGTATTTPGGTITYQVRVWNDGTDPAVNVAVRDILPAGTTFVSAADNAPGPGAFTCNHAAGVINCGAATISGGTTLATARRINIVVTAPQQNVVLTNQVFVDPDNTIVEGNEANNSDTFDTTVSSVINLTILKTGPTVANQSSTADYEIKITNNIIGGGAGQKAIGVVMHDPLPVGLIPLAVEAGTGNNWACQIQGSPINVVDCLGDILPGEGELITIRITVFITAESGRSLDNVACVDPGNVVTESNELDNCSEFKSAVGAPAPKISPDILVSKGVDKSATTPGDTLEYTISVSNVGTAKAKGWDPVSMTGLTVTDTLPGFVNFVDATGSNGWTCSEASAVVTCHDDGSGLAVGQFATLTIHVQIAADAAIPLVNTATAANAVVDTSDPNCTTDPPDPTHCEHETGDHIANNTSTATTSVGGSGFDFVVATITDNPDPVNPGDGVTYTIVAVNAGTTPTPVGDPVHIRIDIPPPTVAAFVGADGTNGFTCGAPASNKVDCVGDMPAGGDTVITVRMGSVLPGSNLTLVAEIDPSNHFTELNEGNNKQTEVTTVSGDICSPGCVDLVATQMLPSPDPVHHGQQLTVNFTIVNVGDSPADFGLPDPPNALINPLLRFDIYADGLIFLVSRTSSNSKVVCGTDGLGATFVESICGLHPTILNPGEGVTITIKVNVASGTLIAAIGQADPLDVIGEFTNDNNSIARFITVEP